jgi:hypothetical protein
LYYYILVLGAPRRFFVGQDGILRPIGNRPAPTIP